MSHIPGAGELVEVRAVRRPQQVPGAPLRFLLDVHLGTLARRLRLLGVDAAYESEDIGDPALAALSAEQRRVLLSRDRGLLRRREIWAGAYVYSDRPEEQLRDVLGRFAPVLTPWTRCTACNGELTAADKESVSSGWSRARRRPTTCSRSAPPVGGCTGGAPTTPGSKPSWRRPYASSAGRESGADGLRGRRAPGPVTRGPGSQDVRVARGEGRFAVSAPLARPAAPA